MDQQKEKPQRMKDQESEEEQGDYDEDKVNSSQNNVESADSEEEEENESQNDYEIDGFVVDDDKESDHEERIEKASLVEEVDSQEEEEENQVKEGKTKRLKKKKSQKMENQDEFDIRIEEEKQESENSEQNFIEQNEEEQDENSQQERQNDKRQGKYKTIYDVFQPQDDMEEEQLDNQLDNINIEILEPHEKDEKFQNEQDQNIIKTDIPERIQLRYQEGIKMQVNSEDLVNETKWIAEKMQQDGSIANMTQDIKKKILKVIELIRNNHCEVMYIYFYKRTEYMPDLNLKHLWKIYELDKDWCMFDQQKKTIEEDLHTLRIKVNEQIVDENIIKMLNSVNELSDFDLISIKEFIEFQAEKYQIDLNFDKKDKFQLHKKPQQRNLAREIRNCSSLYQLAYQVAITPAQFVQNYSDGIKWNSNSNISQLNIAPQDLAQSLVNENDPLLKDAMTILKNLSRYLALEMYHHPLIRHFIKSFFYRTIRISTEPTEEGKKRIDIFDPLYPTKRINRRPPSEFKDELWLLVEQAQKQKLINVYFEFDKQNNRDGLKIQLKKLDVDEIAMTLVQYYNVATHNQNESDVSQKWNVFRIEVIKILLEEYMYPKLQRNLRQELTDKAEKFLLKKCGQKFYEMLKAGPCILSKKDGSQDPPECVMSCILSTDEDQLQELGIVFLDRDGKVLQNDSFRYFCCISDNNAQAQKAIQNEIDQIKEYMSKFQPDLIVVAANNIQAKRLMSKFRSDEFRKYNERMWVTYGDPTIPTMYSKSIHAEKNFKQLSPLIRTAISMGRMKQNPMAEILNLWHDNINYNACCLIPLDPNQNLVNKQKLKEVLENQAVEMVNLVGLDINQIIVNQHLDNQLQFISGLGPRKAAHLLKIIRKDSAQFLNKRAELHLQYGIEKEVMNKCSGMLKVVAKDEDQREKLDETRISKENYSLAKKICDDALEDEDDKEMKNHNLDSVTRIMQQPQKLQDLDYQGYAQHLQQAKKKENMIYVLEFIVQELTNPFADPRDTYKEMQDDQLFYKLTKESEQTFRKYMIVNAQIQGFTQNEDLKVKINGNNLNSFIRKKEILDEGQSNLKLSKIFQVRDVVQAVVLRIDAIENIKDGYNSFKQNQSQFDVLRIELSMKKPKWNQVIKNKFFFQQQINFSSFIVVESEDFPIFNGVQQYLNKPLRSDANDKMRSSISRKIDHPKFKNMGYKAALDYVSSLKLGDFIIRPSQSNQDMLVITWKFWENVIVNIQVYEDKRKFKMNNEWYDSLDEIIERYISSCNTTMQTVSNHKKFLKMSQQEIEQQLKQERNQDETIIRYYFGCFEQFPQYIVLLYIEKKDIVVKEYIKVKSQGLFFHNQYFTSLKELIGWFKLNFSKDEYKIFVKKQKPPFSVVKDQDRQSTYGSESFHSTNRYSDYGRKQNITVKKEQGFNVKQEGGFQVKTEGHTKKEIKNELKFEQNKNASIKCSGCGEYGHSANECKRNSFNEKENNGSMKGQRQIKKCYTCGQDGHFSRQCPMQRQEKCNVCGQYGHKAQTCPQRDRVSKSRSRSRSRSREKSQERINTGGFNQLDTWK